MISKKRIQYYWREKNTQFDSIHQVISPARFPTFLEHKITHKKNGCKENPNCMSEYKMFNFLKNDFHIDDDLRLKKFLLKSPEKSKVEKTSVFKVPFSMINDLKLN
jgi:hypothetical protein